MLGINVTKEVQDLYKENYSDLKKENKEDIRKQKNVSYFLENRTNIFKMAIFTKAIHRSSIGPIKSQENSSQNYKKKIFL